ncbi:MAG TPA: TorF family putative porin, partial [Allosphingosinicella sp.]|nr:TorF family putative porin [Allosphingosinicella sp.]
MIQHLLRSAALAALGFAAFATTPALAQEEAGEASGAFDISATATIVSDYRDRGVSLSDRDPAAQASVDVSIGGFYAGVWVSSIARYSDSLVEADLYAGYAGETGPISYEVGALASLYPGGDGSGDIYEATGSLSYNIGPATARLKLFYAPDQENLDGDNLYASVDARFALPGTPVTLFAQFGRERGSFYGRKHDLSFGAEATRGPFTASFGYFDTDLDGVASGLGRNVR